MSRKLKSGLVIISFLLFWFYIAPFLAEWLIVEKPLKNAGAIFVLSGSSTYRERTRKAAELYKSNISTKIFLTDDGRRGGWSSREMRNPTFAELARNELINQGVPAESIEILDGVVGGTIDEARVLQKNISERGLNSVLLVTSAYHSRRALWTFEKVLADNNLKAEIGIETAAPGEQTPNPSFWWLSPSGWKWIAGEYLKGIFYWLFY